MKSEVMAKSDGPLSQIGKALQAGITRQGLLFSVLTVRPG